MIVTPTLIIQVPSAEDPIQDLVVNRYLQAHLHGLVVTYLNRVVTYESPRQENS